METKQAVIQAFKNTYALKDIKQGIMFQSDHGVQFACDDFKKLRDKGESKQSMPCKGNSGYGAGAESFFKTLEVQSIYRHDLEPDTKVNGFRKSCPFRSFYSKIKQSLSSLILASCRL